jgi:hypothetical protein
VTSFLNICTFERCVLYNIYRCLTEASEIWWKFWVSPKVKAGNIKFRRTCSDGHDPWSTISYQKASTRSIGFTTLTCLYRRNCVSWRDDFCILLGRVQNLHSTASQVCNNNDVIIMLVIIMKCRYLTLQSHQVSAHWFSHIPATERCTKRRSPLIRWRGQDGGVAEICILLRNTLIGSALEEVLCTQWNLNFHSNILVIA